MSVAEILVPLCATFTGAFFAFRYQHSIENNREKRSVVQTLMMYRNVGADELDWIKALNAADLVFHDNEKVRRLLSLFFQYTAEPARMQAKEHVDVYYKMVYEMCQDCGYSQMMEADLRNFYSPKALSKHYPNSFDEFVDINEPPYPGLLEEITHLGLA